MDTIRQRIYDELAHLDESAQRETLDFVVFLRQKQQRELEADMDRIIEENIEALKELAK